MNERNKQKAFLAYLHYIGITQKKLFSIFEHHKEYEAFFETLSPKTLAPYYKSTDIEKILKQKEALLQKKTKIDAILEKIHAITYDEREYPLSLKHTKDPPYVLYVYGKYPHALPYFAVIGSRKHSMHAFEIIHSFVKALSNVFTIVSWGAIGCDTIVHTTLITWKQPSVIILPEGIEAIFKKNRFSPYVKEEGTTFISPFPIDAYVHKYYFLVRNAIIAWISQGIFIVEAWETSGTIQTAYLAQKAGKPIYTIPGSIHDPHYRGNNILLQKGIAKLALTPEDIIIQEFPEKKNETRETTDDDTFPMVETPIQKHIYTLLRTRWALSIDEIMEESVFSYEEITYTLSLLEMKGLISENIFGKYSIL